MTKHHPCMTPHPRRRTLSMRALAGMLALAAAMAAGGCSSSAGDAARQAAATTPHNATLSADQRQHIKLYTVASSTFHKTVTASGAVDFDNDQATSVLAPISGPVVRLLVSTGQEVAKGQPLAVVDSPDFAAAIGNYNKALVTARNASRLADADKDLIRHDGLPRRELEQAQTDAASAEADRDAARQALLALGVDA